MIMKIQADITSLNAVTIGPAATAGSIPTRANKKGDELPKSVEAEQALNIPIDTVTPMANGV